MTLFADKTLSRFSRIPEKRCFLSLWRVSHAASCRARLQLESERARLLAEALDAWRLRALELAQARHLAQQRAANALSKALALRISAWSRPAPPAQSLLLATAPPTAQSASSRGRVDTRRLRSSARRRFEGGRSHSCSPGWSTDSLPTLCRNIHTVRSKALQREVHIPAPPQPAPSLALPPPPSFSGIMFHFLW